MKLIETMHWDGRAVRHLALHMARLEAGCAALGWPAPDLAALRAYRGVPVRLRLTCERSGQTVLEAGPLPPPQPLWRVGLAATRLASDDPWLGVKSTRRGVYDAARAGMAAGLDEVVFVNERGEVCDGSITTVFFDRGAGMRTPPLSCGLLPGVLRASLAVPEEVLLAQDLPRVRLWVGNAVRGLIAAAFVG